MVVLPLLITVWLLWSALMWLNGLGLSLLASLHILAFSPGMVYMLLALLSVGLLFQVQPGQLALPVRGRCPRCVFR